MIVRLKHVKRVRAKGRWYYYHRITGERLPEDGEDRVRRVLDINAGLKRPSRRVRVGSVEAVANLYRGAPEFKNLRPRTRESYELYLKTICRAWGDLPISGITRQHALGLRDKHADTPASADRMITVLRVLLEFAVDREYRRDNPAKGVSKLRKPSQVEGHKPWPDWAIEKFLATHDGTMMGLAFKLGLYTGQREGDVLAMRWADYDGAHITVKQSKTGTSLQILVHATLRQALEAQTPVSPIILTTARNRPFSGPNFRHHWRKAMRDAGLDRQGLTYHGLRYSAADQLAELGCSLKEIAAVTGHASLQMLQKYTKGAEQKRLNEAAILRWEEHERTAKVENRADETDKLRLKR